MKKTVVGILIIVLAVTVASVGLSCAVKTEQAGGTEGGVLNIICFNGYADPAWVKPFEEKYKCTVNVTYAGTV
ncbi:MAG: hypothetical protein M1308_12755, partial [Actinobacteria bacterium]|nr:hypothetical protein [Actinomycetota bacterium]